MKPLFLMSCLGPLVVKYDRYIYQVLHSRPPGSRTTLDPPVPTMGAMGPEVCFKRFDTSSMQ